MTAIAFDLGTKTGYAIDTAGVLASGVMNFASRRHEGGGMRYLRFRQAIRELLATHRGGVVFYEEVRHHRGVDAAHVYGGLLSQLQSVCEEEKVPYTGIPVGSIKKFATGKGNSDKKAMVAAAISKYPTQQIADDNQADAIFCLYCGLETLK